MGLCSISVRVDYSDDFYPMIHEQYCHTSMFLSALIVALRVFIYIYIFQLLDLISSDGRPYGGTDPDFLWELAGVCGPRWATVI